ncbi:hypothetical protein Q5H92_14650 [Hymenobacter sp. M29]|uniref:Uncharacterized protein n=1 Tax=Hymenobacter mellowenesis TaxID=3063995 RepID=A0ABT9ACN5_9BACT|nr:hypothetical protein [Hymenobacter sp. M29]MDO7847605.1 hypothetical protein [Hymenobacter sp. M29]
MSPTDQLPTFQGPALYGFKSSLYFPSLLRQQNWVVRDYGAINYRDTLNYSFTGDTETEEVLVQGPHVILPEPYWEEEQGWKLPTAEKEFLTQAFEDVGEEVHFFFRGYPTYLYSQEYTLLEPILPLIQTLTIDEREGIPYRRLHLYGILTDQPNT